MSSPKEILSSLTSSASSSERAAVDKATSQLCQCITQLTGGAVAKNPAEDFIWSFWRELFHSEVPAIAMAASTSWTPFPSSAALDKLVSLVTTLKATSATETALWGQTVRVWQDLPLLNPQVRELLDQDPTLGPPKTTPSETRQKVWLTQMSFLARLMHVSALELDHVVIWILRGALEEEGPEDNNRDLKTSVAAAFLGQCAKEIRAKSLASEEVDENEKHYTRQGGLYDGPVWFCKERWDFWKARLTLFREGGSVNGLDKERITCALGAMREAEKEK